MTQHRYLGEFEQVVLLALMRLGPEAYGVTIRREIQERTGRMGLMVITTSKVTYRNQFGSVVATQTSTGIRY